MLREWVKGIAVLSCFAAAARLPLWAQGRTPCADLLMTAQNLLHQVAVRVKQRETFTVQEVLMCQVCDQRGLAGAGLPDDIHVRQAVGAFDTEAMSPVAEVGLSKGGNAIVRAKIL